jgi:hypothetical protein
MTLDRVSSTIGRRGSLRVRSAQPASLAYTNDDAGGAITHTPAPDYLDDDAEREFAYTAGAEQSPAHPHPEDKSRRSSADAWQWAVLGSNQ